MAEPHYHIRGRHVGPKDLFDIRTLITDNWASGRTAISRMLCERWGWRQPNGQPKEMACRALLLALEAKGELTLPPRQKESFRAPRRTDRKIFSIDTSPLEGRVADFGSLKIVMVRQTPDGNYSAPVRITRQKLCFHHEEWFFALEQHAQGFRCSEALLAACR